MCASLGGEIAFAASSAGFDVRRLPAPGHGDRPNPGAPEVVPSPATGADACCWSTTSHVRGLACYRDVVLEFHESQPPQRAREHDLSSTSSMRPRRSLGSGTTRGRRVGRSPWRGQGDAELDPGPSSLRNRISRRSSHDAVADRRPTPVPLPTACVERVEDPALDGGGMAGTVSRIRTTAQPASSIRG